MKKKLLVSIVMGSQSDWRVLTNAADILSEFKVTFEKIVSAHRTPDRLYEYAKLLKQKEIEVVIAGAGGAAHLPGMIAAMTTIPVLGVPVETKALKGIDSLLSIIQMPAGIPLPTLAIGNAGAKNAALASLSILAKKYPIIATKLEKFRKKQTKSIKKTPQDEKK